MDRKLTYIPYNIKFCPFKDRHEISIKILNERYGIKLCDLDVSPIDTLINIFQTVIPQKKRKIIESVDFQCPEKEKKGYANLRSKILIGKDLNPHLSKQIFNPKFNDGMHLDFGLYHLHLGVDFERDKRGNYFSERTGPLLVAYITDDMVYCVGIFEHSSELWSNSKLIEIIDREWPHLIEDKKVKYAKDISPKIEDKDRNRLRKIGLNTVVTLPNGSNYQWLGGGIAASGGSAKAGMLVAHNNGLIFRATQAFIKMIVESDSFKDNIPIYYGDIELKLISLPDRKFSAIDKNSGIIYHFNFSQNEHMVINPTYLPRYAIFHTGVEMTTLSIIINAILKVNRGDSINAYMQYPSIYIISN